MDKIAPLAALSLLQLVFALTASQANGLESLATRRAPMNYTQLFEPNNILSTLEREEKTRFGTNGISMAVGGEQPLKEFHGLILYGPVEVGTPPQTLQLGFPFHRNQFWVYGAKSSPPRSLVRHRVKKYNEGESSSFRQGNLAFSLPLRLAKGNYAVDTVQVGGRPVDIQMGVAQSASFVYGALPIDGEFGIGPKPMDNSGIQSPMNKVFNSLDQPLMSIWIDKQSLLTEGQSQITFGGLDKDNCNGDWGFVDMADEGGWHFPMDSVTVGDRVIPLGGEKARLSDENHLIIGPFSKILRILGPLGAKPTLYGAWEIDCNAQYNAPDIVFNLDRERKAKVSISPFTYIVKIPFLSKCMTTFVSYPDIKSFGWVVGESFYDGRCLSMDWGKRQIGFATTKDY